MEEKDKWIKDFRDRMADYSEPVPAGLWEQLERDLSTPKVIPMWRRWQAVAAVALLVMASSLTVWFWNSSSVDYMEQQSTEIATLPKSEYVTPNSILPTQPVAQTSTVEAVKRISSVKKIVAAIIPTATNEVIEKEVKEDKLIEEQIEENYSEKGNAEGQSTQKTKEDSPKTATHPVSGKRSSNYYAYAVPHKKKDKNWSIGIAAGNSPFSATNGYGGYGRFQVPSGKRSAQNDMMYSPTETLESTPSVLPSYPVGTKEYAYNQILMNNLSEGEVNSDVEHKMPVTFGASLRFDLDDKWAIETGLTYTLLSSDLRSGGKSSYIEQEQRLHYVGIPLKLNRNIWSNRRFEVYASAGGAVEKCVSGKLETTYVVGQTNQTNENENIKVKPLQWSLSAAAGAQFKITDKLGIYAEPGVVYYFDDNSEVSTIRKEHPFNFNIQLGVRFTLPK